MMGFTSIQQFSRLAILTLLAFCFLTMSCRRRRGVPEGYQGIVEYEQRYISFEVPGRIQKVHAQRGDVILAGGVLAELDPTLEELSRQTRENEVQTAKADLSLLEAGARREDIASMSAQVAAARTNEKLLRKERERVKKLAANGSVSQADLDRANADLDRAAFDRRALEQRLLALRRGSRPEEIAVAEARVDSQSSQVALASERIARFSLTSKSEGVVLDVLVEEGELASVGTNAFIMADTHHPFVEVFVPVGEIDGIHVGCLAHIKVDATSEVFQGAVEHVAYKTEFTPKFLFSDRERPNLVLRVRIRIDDSAGKLNAGVPAFVQIDR
ncbi:MAG: HlyD family efflux transporter periplasmic adaptor subunit [Polyangiaceae bacterium]|nr:HlyD family efflux transporter periplasmic adaptor subunit [Polyangiaceae bacterium]